MITQTDFIILDFIQSHMRSNAMDIIMKCITALGDHGILFIALTLVLLILPKTRQCGKCMTIAMATGFLMCNLILKNAIGRIRPYEIAQFPIIVAELSDYSFPSGHTTFSFLIATVLLAFYKKWGIFAFITAFLIGFSRLYLYVHYPTDVAAGALLGILIGLSAVKIYSKFTSKNKITQKI